jgi:hypothetical protein
MADSTALGDLPPLATPSQLAEILQTTVDSLAQDRYRRRGVPLDQGRRTRPVPPRGRPGVPGRQPVRRYRGLMNTTPKSEGPGVAAPRPSEPTHQERGPYMTMITHTTDS